MLSQSDLLHRMAADLAMLPAHLEKIIKTAPLRYKIFEIPKKAGGNASGCSAGTGGQSDSAMGGSRNWTKASYSQICNSILQWLINSQECRSAYRESLHVEARFQKLLSIHSWG